MAKETNPLLGTVLKGLAASERDLRLADECASACAEEAGPEPCAELTVHRGPEQTLRVREPVELESLPLHIGDPVEQQKLLRLGCTSLRSASASLRLDLVYEQRWFFRRQWLTSLSGSIALAPLETARLQTTVTQRKHLTQSAIDETEEATSEESSFVDREVLNVARSMSKTKNWTVSGNATFTVPKLTGGVSGSVSETVNRTASLTAESTREATQKSASNLRVLQRTEVREVNEFSDVRQTTRTVRNPFSDRSLLVRAWDLGKEYCVDFALAEVRPSIAIRVSIAFDTDFVLRNGDFLVKTLLDRYLQAELTEALQVARAMTAPIDRERATRYAKTALKYLFHEIAIFNFDGATANSPLASFTPGTGFDVADSGFWDAVRNDFGILFTTLNVYYRLYLNEVPADESLALDLALSLEEAATPLWSGIEESGKVENVLDLGDRTEIFRRLGGFLAFVHGVVRPLVAEEEAAVNAADRLQRAQFVLSRVVHHLQCHEKYYTARFMAYVDDISGGEVLRDFTLDAIRNHMTLTMVQSSNVLKHFNVADIFLDGQDVVVPARAGWTQESWSTAPPEFAGRGGDVHFGVITSESVILPTDGVHFEPMVGSCVLADVPDSDTAPSIVVSIVDEPSGQDGG